MSTITTPSGPPKNGLRFLQNIITESSKDVGTQTTNQRRKMRSLSPSNPSYVNIGKEEVNFHESTFSLFVVGDDKDCHVLRLSVDDAKYGRENSCQLSLKPVTTNDISTDFKIPIKSKRSHKIAEQTSLKSVEKLHKKRCPAKEYSRPVENDFTTEHRLNHSINPSVIAWLKLKNFEEKEKQREKRRKTKELKKVAEQEEEKKQIRIKENEKRYTKWLHEKKLAEKRARKALRVKTKTNAIETQEQDQNEDLPPPNYTVVPSFKGAVAWTEAKQCNISPTTKSSNSNSAKKGKKYTKRPRTTDGFQSKSPELPARPKTTDVSHCENNPSNRISYDVWMRKKRVEGQERAKEKKRDTIDDVLTEGILKRARKRIENIRQGKKELDTGLPKWRAKNRVKSISDGKCASEDISSTRRKIYSGPYCLPPESETQFCSQPNGLKLKEKHFVKKNIHNTSEVVAKQCIGQEIETIRQFCDNIKLELKTNVEQRNANQDVLFGTRTQDVKPDEIDQG